MTGFDAIGLFEGCESCTLVEALLQSLDAVSVGIVLLGADCRPILSNRLAKTIYESGSDIRLNAGMLFTVSDRDEGAKLQAAIVNAVLGNITKTELLRVSKVDKGLPYTLMIHPLDFSLSTSEKRPYAVMLIIDPDRLLSISPQVIADFFGLTPAEASLSVAIAQGYTTSEYAQKKDVTFHTVNSQLRSVMSKTGVTRQAELVKLILSSLMLVGFTNQQNEVINLGENHHVANTQS